jgi:hypothetical protein
VTGVQTFSLPMGGGVRGAVVHYFYPKIGPKLIPKCRLRCKF